MWLFVLKYWREFAIGGAALVIAALCGVVALQHADAKAAAVELASTKANLADVTKNRDDWKADFEKAQDLEQQTAQAHATETATLLKVQQSLATTKQGIVNAPGASDSFTFSDAAYGFLRPPVGKPAASAAGPDASVDQR